MVKIICEGSSDKNKIKELLDFLDIEYSNDNFVVMGNKSNIFKSNHDNYRTILTLIDADKIDKILFVVDADYQKDNSEYGGYENSQNRLKELIEKLNIVEISSWFISCNPDSKDGYLESLLLSTVDYVWSRWQNARALSLWDLKRADVKQMYAEDNLSFLLISNFI
jgi:hypothetical protein